jgi:hypothetical protein
MEFDLEKLIAELSPTEFLQLRNSLFLEDDELLQARFAVLAEQNGYPPFVPKLSPLPSGAIPIYHNAFFPWGGFPYPKEHGRLGSLIARLSDSSMQKMAKNMFAFQQASLDHNLKPVCSFFEQEGRSTHSDLEKANANFFNSVGISPNPSSSFIDRSLGIVARKNNHTTIIGLASGCKSGMGTFLYEDGGIINYGPLLSSVGNCSGFGMAGRGQNIKIQEEMDNFFLSYFCRLAAPSQRHKSLASLEDSGFSGIWMHGEIEGNPKGLAIKCQFEGISALQQIKFSIFGRGSACIVASSHRLSPRSLDRYQGPSQSVKFMGEVGGVEIEAGEGVGKMEIIPLAGDNSFWGADFMATYMLCAPQISFYLKIQETLR